jgi:hypothetical protein
LVLAIMLLAGSLGQASAGTKAEPGIRLIGQPQHDETLDATFSVGMAPDGSAWTQLESGDLKVEKWATAAGDATIVLNYQKDRVALSLKSGGYTVSRGKRSASFSPSDQSDDRRTAFRTLLVGSPAVRAFRALANAMERRNGQDTAAMISTMVDGAIVAMLDGDDGAIERLGRRLKNRFRPGLRQARTALPVQFTDCVLNYELALLSAWDAYAGCINTNFWQYFFFAPFCAFEWGIRSQQYAYAFIACMAIPG